MTRTRTPAAIVWMFGIMLAAAVVVVAAREFLR
jgi:hypothetical protein